MPSAGSITINATSEASAQTVYSAENSPVSAVSIIVINDSEEPCFLQCDAVHGLGTGSAFPLAEGEHIVFDSSIIREIRAWVASSSANIRYSVIGTAF